MHLLYEQKTLGHQIPFVDFEFENDKNRKDHFYSKLIIQSKMFETFEIDLLLFGNTTL